MGIIELFLIAVGLSMDAFAVSVCKGLSAGKVRLRHALIAGVWFGGFQALMPLVGFLLANSFYQVIEVFDHWIAFVLLLIIGGNMIKEALSSGEEETSDDLSCRAMVLLAIATSIDALAAGISLLAVVELPLITAEGINWSSVWVAVSLIGVITFGLSALGVKLGNRFGARYEKKAELLGGVILVVLGTKILLEHLGVL